MSHSVKFVEVYNRSGGGTIRDYSVRTVYVNPSHVSSLIEDENSKRLMHEGFLPEGLDKRQEFTRLSISAGSGGRELVVLGAIETVQKKLYEGQVQLLKG